MDWHDGYVSGIEYLVEFFQDQGPTHLNVACIINGVEPVTPGAPFTYFELGCGQGLTANVLAAANPHGAFFAADFNPSHIAGAQELADLAGLTNITLLEKSFAELAAGEVALPLMDYITLHGVYTWVSPEQRVFVARFIERYLKPGGVLYVSYNAMPGWSAALPLQRLLLEQGNLQPGTQHQKIQSARDLINGLTHAKATYFCEDVSPNLRHYIDAVLVEDNSRSSYIAHEYMNQGWEPLYHADVVAGLANCKLDYAGSAEFSWAQPNLYLNAGQQELLAGIDDPVLRETVKDYLRNTCFRR
ncbi:MAG: class I SAM-dependent methyltransferase, partial [Janthinobacterium lividum]